MFSKFLRVQRLFPVIRKKETPATADDVVYLDRSRSDERPRLACARATAIAIKTNYSPLEVGRLIESPRRTAVYALSRGAGLENYLVLAANVRSVPVIQGDRPVPFVTVGFSPFAGEDSLKYAKSSADEVTYILLK